MHVYTLYGKGTPGPRTAAAPQAGRRVAVRSARAPLCCRPAIHCRATEPTTGGPVESPDPTKKSLLSIECIEKVSGKTTDSFGGVSTSLLDSTLGLLVVSEAERGHSYTHTLDPYTAGTHPFSDPAAACAATPCSSSRLVPVPTTVYATEGQTDRQTDRQTDNI